VQNAAVLVFVVVIFLMHMTMHATFDAMVESNVAWNHMENRADSRVRKVRGSGHLPGSQDRGVLAFEIVSAVNGQRQSAACPSWTWFPELGAAFGGLAPLHHLN